MLPALFCLQHFPCQDLSQVPEILSVYVISIFALRGPHYYLCRNSIVFE